MPNSNVDTSPEIELRELRFGSDDQLKSIKLREKVLRQPLGMKFTPEELAAELDQTHLGALIMGEVIGVLLLKKLDRNTLKMRQVAVSPEVQNQGVGKKLVEFAENWARLRGYRMIELHARFNAISFYRKLNYEIVGDEFEEVGIPHFKMYKEIK